MATYPNEAWPSDAAVETLDGTMDATTGLPFIAKGTSPASVPSYAVQYNRRQDRQNRILAAGRQGMVVDEGGLKIGVYPVAYTLGGLRKSFAGASAVSVPDASSKVVYLDASATLHVADAWPASISSYLPLASLVTAGGQIDITDCRPWTMFHVPSLEAPLVNDRRLLHVYRGSVGNSQSDITLLAFDPPADVVLEGVQVYCSAVAANTSVEVKSDGASVLSAAAVPVAGTVVKPTVATATLSAGDLITVHVTTDGAGSVSDLTVTLLLKSPLAD